MNVENHAPNQGQQGFFHTPTINNHLAPRTQTDRIEEAGRTFHRAACRYRAQTNMPVATAGLIIATSLTEVLFETDPEQFTGSISRELLAGLRAFEDPPAALAPAKLRPAADDLRLVCAPLFPAADEVCRDAVDLHLSLMGAAQTLRNPPHPFAWYELDEVTIKYQAMSESIGRFADAFSARLESGTGAV